MLEAEQRFRKVIGYSDLAKLALAVEQDVAASRSSPTLPATAEPAAIAPGEFSLVDKRRHSGYT